MKLYHIAAAALLAVAVAAPALAADKKSQSDQTQSILDKQKAIADALKKKLPDSPDDLQKMLDGLKADLATEQTRHDQAMASWNKELQSANDSGNKKHAKNVQAAINKENDAYNDKSADLNKQIAAVKAKLDQVKPPTK
jgi:chromosome segregation ATPase